MHWAVPIEQFRATFSLGNISFRKQIADVFMYAFNNAYTIPLFTTSNLFNSSISVKTKNSHTSSKEAITKLLIEYNNKKRMNNRGIHMFRF